MNPGALIVLAIILIIFIIKIVQYKKSSTQTQLPKNIQKIIKETIDNPNGLVKLTNKMKETFKDNEEMLETFTDMKDIRYGKIGCNNCPNGESVNQWIKLARVTVNGPWNAKAFTLEIYPRIRWSSSSRQTIIALIRNADKDLETPYVVLTTHNEAQDNTRTFKDIRVVRVGGSGVNNNIIEVWGQMATSWGDIVYSMFYLYGIESKDEIIVERSPMQANPPGGQNWGVSERVEPNGTFTKDITMAIDPKDKNIKGIGMRRTDEAGRYHEWKQWHMNDMYGRNDYQLYEYAADSKGATCGGNWNDGARCLPRFTIKGSSGNVGINTTNPRNTLEVAGDLRVTGRVIVGNTVLKPSGNSLLIEKEDGRVIMRIDPDWDKIQIYQNSDGKAPYFYYNKNGDFYNYGGGPNPNMRHGDKMTIRNSGDMNRLQSNYSWGRTGQFSNRNRGGWEQLFIEKCGFGGLGDNQACW